MLSEHGNDVETANVQNFEVWALERSRTKPSGWSIPCSRLSSCSQHDHACRIFVQGVKFEGNEKRLWSSSMPPFQGIELMEEAVKKDLPASKLMLPEGFPSVFRFRDVLDPANVFSCEIVNIQLFL
ncbi:hypothetical protein BTVI_132803 [Pitangus sulphuratus]|nr:hypothetical protein BTVI_132803 [Pitangus sulphuratus]